MKRVRCPKCDNFITFDETRYKAGQRLVFECPNCNKQFGIRMGISKLRRIQKEENKVTIPAIKDYPYGYLHVIENVFHYQQNLPLTLGDNVVGHYTKENPINCPIETGDPSVDMTHCVVNVSYDKHKKLKYVLRDGFSYTGTFVDNEVLRDNECRNIQEGTLFTIGATSIILHTLEEEKLHEDQQISS